MKARVLDSPHREIGIVGIISAGIALFFALRLPPDGDASAHFHRTLLVLKGDFLWDNFWYRGNYPLGSYSLFYYLPAALVGNTVVAVAATLAAALLFALLVRDLWGRGARWSALLFAVCATQPLLRTEYPFALGVALLLATLVALQRRKLLAASVAAALCAGTSSLAFAFLVFAAVGIWLARPTRDRTTVGFAAVVFIVAIVSLLVSRKFEMPWSAYPFPPSALARIIVVSAIGLILTRLARGPRVLAGIYAASGVVGLVGYAVPTPIGLNFERSAFLLVPLLIVPAARMEGRARLVACAAVLALVPLAASPALGPSLENAFATHPNQTRIWSTAVALLHTRTSPDYRVEVVPTASHWEAYYLPRAGIAIARGWYRQLDIALNSVLYPHRKPLAAATYRRWLDANAVKWVLVARRSPIDAIAGAAEQKLIESGHSGLRLVHSSRAWALYEVPHPSPMLRPSSLAEVTAVTPDKIDGVIRRRGTYRLDVTYMPYWEARAGIVIRRGHDGTTLLRVARPGPFTLTAASEGLFDLG
jgi:hypothetical protein